MVSLLLLLLLLLLLVFVYSFRLYVDGVLAGSGVMVGPNLPLQLNGTIYIGQEQDALAGGLDAMQSTSAHIAQMNVWSDLLQEDVIAAIASCSTNPHGDIFSTDVHDVEVVNAGEETKQVAALCLEEMDFVIVPEKWSLRRSLHFCKTANSEMFVPESDELNARLFNESRQFLDKCGGKSYRYLRLGATDSATDGDWRRFSSGAALRYTAWYSGEPNDGIKSDCVVMRKSQSGWGDVACKDEYCFPCLKDVDRFLQIRGLCFSNEHHTRFLLDGYVNGAPFFRGYYGHAVFMSKGGAWVLHHVLTNTTLATMAQRRSLIVDYPLGRHEWQAESPFCHNLAGDTMELSLSFCATADFMCADGSCVPRGVRCNLLEDCADGSDEDRCDLLELSVGYNGHRPPPGVTPLDPLIVTPTVNIIRFSHVDDLNLALLMELEVKLSWTDRNLKFKNLKRNVENKLSAEEVRRVWRPETEFLNVNGGQQQQLKQTVFVQQTGEADPPLFNDVMMDTVFPATAGMLVQRTLYSASFSCNYGLFMYPFDTQRCSVLLRFATATSSVVKFENATVEYRGLSNLAKYTVGALTVTTETRPATNDRLTLPFRFLYRL
ncbi:uncharacterized protein LOC135103172 [Scylla paramamosain]|uniref:uncharacterized protein LOC135103172 n=1 Tax=Scylla paramamosain TaxID=85552 RepID=UPI003083E45A